MGFSGGGGGLWYCCEWHSRHRAEWGWKKQCPLLPSLSLPRQEVGAACCGGGMRGAPSRLTPWLPAAPLSAPPQAWSHPSVPPAAGRAVGLRRDLAAASCPTFKGMQNQTAGWSHNLRAGTALLLVFTLHLVDWPFKKTRFSCCETLTIALIYLILVWNSYGYILIM